jgi:murein DD-endopeptidase MepM/ murein hydrolase activator NlpD
MSHHAANKSHRALILLALASTSSLLSTSTSSLVAAQSLARAAQNPLGERPVASSVAGVEQSLSQANSEAERLDLRARQLAQEADGLGARKAAAIEQARRDARRMYHLRMGSALILRNGPAALLDHLARVAHTERSLRASIEEVNQVTARESSIVAERASVAVDQQQLAARRTTLAAQRQQLELFGSPDTLGVQTTAMANPLGEPVTVYGGRGAEPTEGSFASQAGRLLLPLSGRAQIRRVIREGAEGPGLEITSSVGTPVRAVFGGRVAFSDRYGAMGRLVIVEHGEHYYTVSANLGTVSVRVGEEVQAGAILGTVGDEGRGPILYFEVRRGSETIDPTPWFGVQ